MGQIWHFWVKCGMFWSNMAFLGQTWHFWVNHGIFGKSMAYSFKNGSIRLRAQASKIHKCCVGDMVFFLPLAVSAWLCSMSALVAVGNGVLGQMQWSTLSTFERDALS